MVLPHFPMSVNRLEALKQMLEAQPENALVRYGLAQEYANSGDFEEALSHFNRLLEIQPDYSAAYYHAGRTLEKAGRTDDARVMYERGIQVTTRNGDAHTRSELQAALDMLF
jgi:Flp pilus assembly protein TadD